MADNTIHEKRHESKKSSLGSVRLPHRRRMSYGYGNDARGSLGSLDDFSALEHESETATLLTDMEPRREGKQHAHQLSISTGRIGPLLPRTRRSDPDSATSDYYELSPITSRPGATPSSFVKLHPRRRSYAYVGFLFFLLALIGLVYVSGTPFISRDKWNQALSDYWDAALTYTAPSGASHDTEKQRPGATSGGNGSTIVLQDGTSFVYTNTMGGTWNSVPFAKGARAQDDSPPIGEEWNYAKHQIRGVNVGGWLVLEPFVTPHMFEPYTVGEMVAEDEYSLSVILGSNLSTVLTAHYETFITERDFADIASSGLNWVRIPIPYWAIETHGTEPYLAYVAWDYFVRALGWARKYGLRVDLDLHTAPGSQNGWNHSGKLGSINMLFGGMGIVNAQRTLNYIRALAEFAALPWNSELIGLFSVLNEPMMRTISQPVMQSFYFEAYRAVREVTGLGRGPLIAFHDGFLPSRLWSGFLRGADRTALDTHLYVAFIKPTLEDTLLQQAYTPCQRWEQRVNESSNNFGFTMLGEWSLAFNDCGLYVNGVRTGTRYEGTFPDPEHTLPEFLPFRGTRTCELWDNDALWDDQLKGRYRELALATMDATKNYFFWTWKTGNSIRTGRPTNTPWSYKRNLELGIMPRDPRVAEGQCLRMGKQYGLQPRKRVPRTGALARILRDTSGQIDPKQVALHGTFPPPKIGIFHQGRSFENVPEESVAWHDTATLPTLDLVDHAHIDQNEEDHYMHYDKPIRLEGDMPSNATLPPPASSLWYSEKRNCQYPGAYTGNMDPMPQMICDQH